MQENKKLELSILQCLIKEDIYNTGMSESEFLAAFKKYSNYIEEKNVFVNTIVIAHCKLLKARKFIEYGAASSGTVIGPMLPAGYDFIENVEAIDE